MTRNFLHKTFLRFSALALMAGQAAAQSSYQPSPENLQARREFQDDKYGMFIHWGVYSVLGDGEWVLQQFQVAENVLFDFVRIGFRIKLLQFEDELRDGMLAVAAGDDFKAGPVQAEGPFGHEQDFLALIFAQAHAGGKLRFGLGIRRHWEPFTVYRLPHPAKAKTSWRKAAI